VNKQSVRLAWWELANLQAQGSQQEDKLKKVR